MSYIQEYWDKIQSGEITTGYFVKLQLQKLINELNDDAIKKDFTAANKRIKFIECECRHAQAPFAGKPFKLELFQKAIIEAIYAFQIWNEELKRYVRKYQRVLLLIGRKNGKALALDTPIKTSKGYKLMADITVGDLVVAPDGRYTPVIAVTPIQYNRPCYELTFSDGSRIVADKEHEWRVTINGRTSIKTSDYIAHTRKRYYVDNRYIASCRKIASVPVKCIQVTGGMYLCGQTLIPTHNSPLISALSLAEWVCGEMGTNILFGSNDYDQAGILFDATNAMREESPKLIRCTRKNLQGIFWGNKKQRIKRGKFSPQNKGSIKKLSARTGAKEGKNIKVGAVDEVHEMKDNSLVMPIRQALSTQDEPLYIEITTEGFTEDGYLDEELQEAHQVLAGEAENEHWLIFLYQQDNEEEVWQDEKAWYKSNPGLGVIKKWSFLRQMVNEAKTSRATRRFVLAKDFNIRQSTNTAWLDLATIDNKAVFDIKELQGQYFIGSLDFAETTDLCSAKALFVDPETRRMKTLSMYFIPETKADAVLNKLNPEKKDYRTWERQGFVTICPGSEIDAQAPADWFMSLFDQGMIPFKIGYDNWHSKDFRKIIGDYFGESVLERIGMDFLDLSGPMRLLETQLQTKQLNYNNNPVDRWCLANTSCKLNNIGQIMPVKKYGQSKNRIDGTLGFIIGLATFSRFKSDYFMLQRK